MHALVLEANYLVAALIEAELNELGYNSTQVVDRECDAIAAARQRCPDLITAEDSLTDGSGIKAIEAICAHKTIPVVYIVGDPNRIRMLVPRAVLIGKPFGGTRLRQAVAEAIELQQGVLLRQTA